MKAESARKKTYSEVSNKLIIHFLGGYPFQDRRNFSRILCVK